MGQEANFLNLLALSMKVIAQCYLCIFIHLFFFSSAYFHLNAAFSVGTHVRPSGCSLSTQVPSPAAIGWVSTGP